VANYLTGLSLDQPFFRTAGSSTSYYLSDALGSIVGLADQSGAVPTSNSYEPYGRTMVSGTASSSFFGFTGRENDSTGALSLFSYRSRSYSPGLQRFLTEDLIGLKSGDPNPYVYVGNDPLGAGDPLGLRCCLPHGQPPSIDPVQCILDRIHDTSNWLGERWSLIRKDLEQKQQISHELFGELTNPNPEEDILVLTAQCLVGRGRGRNW